MTQITKNLIAFLAIITLFNTVIAQTWLQIPNTSLVTTANVGIGMTTLPQSRLHLHQDFAFNPFPPPGSFVLQPVYTQWTNRIKNNSIKLS